MSAAKQIQILDKAVYISHSTWRGMHPTIVGQIGLSNLGMTIDLEGKLWIQTR